MSTIFVTGGTGVLGRGVVPLLVAAGHTVRASARSAAASERLRSMGAAPVEVDLFDAEAVSRAVEGTDAILHLATSIPPVSRARRAGAWLENDRLRTDTTRFLVDAALAQGIPRVVTQSVTFTYADGGPDWLGEDSPIESAPNLDSTLELERQVARMNESGGTGVVVRFGAFYGPEASHTIDAVSMARRGIPATIGRPGAYVSVIHTDDAAHALVAAIDAPGGTYNAADDEPLTRRAFNDALTDAFGMLPVRFPPETVERAVGGSGVGYLSRSQRVSSAHLRAVTGWRPVHGDARSGWRDVARHLEHRDSAGLATHAALLLLALTGLAVGAWAAFAPRGFFDSFPGVGQHWVATDGPYNEHLVRDFGALNLALGVVATTALVYLTRPLVVAAAAGWLTYGVPHLVYHFRHSGTLSTGDAAALLTALTFTAALALLVLSGSRLRARSPG